jgi:hypothetical protein
MNNQEVFDGIMKWLTRPGAERCSTTKGSGGQCMYYDSVTQNRCAIGGHLPLDIAKKLGRAAVGIEGILTESDEELFDVDDLNLDLVPLIRDFYKGVETELLDRLQRLHDNNTSWGAEGFIGWEEANYIAERFGLTLFPEVRRAD